MTSDDPPRAASLLGSDASSAKSTVLLDGAPRAAASGLDEALEAAQIGLWSWEAETNYVCWDARACALVGFPAGTSGAESAGLLKVLHPADRKRLQLEISRALEARNLLESEFRIIAPQHQGVHSLGIRAQGRWDSRGTLLGLAGACWDVVERRSPEGPLLRERFLMQTLMENIPDISIYFKDVEHRFIRVNKALADRMKIADPQQALGKTDYDFFSVEHARHAREDERQVLASGLPMIGKVEKEVLPGGSERWLLTTKLPLRDEGGQIVGTFGVSREITELKQAEAALRQSDARYRLLLDSVTDYVYTVQLQNGQVVSTLHGPGCLAVTSYSADEFKSDPWLWYRIIHEEDRDEVVASTARMVRARAPVALEHRLVTREGAIRWVRNKQAPRYDEEGRLISYDGLISDITERKMAEERLREANGQLTQVLADLTASHEDLKNAQMQLIQAEKLQSIGTLAAGVAHEVKNPLAMLQMGIDCLGNMPPDEPEQMKVILEEMQLAIARANAVISDLLDFSAPKDLLMQPVSINELVEQALRLVRVELVKSKVHLETHLGEGLSLCRVDANKIEQVLVNVFTNAFHAMPGGGTLAVRTVERPLEPEEVEYEKGDRGGTRLRVGERAVIVEVTDTGSGIPEDKLSSIFDPFFTTKATGKGTGLGLAVVKKIIELHNGAIRIVNRREGGVSVTIYLKREGI